MTLCSWQFFGCWWRNFNIDGILWMLMLDAYVKRYRHRHLTVVVNTFRPSAVTNIDVAQHIFEVKWLTTYLKFCWMIVYKTFGSLFNGSWLQPEIITSSFRTSSQHPETVCFALNTDLIPAVNETLSIQKF